MKKVMIIILNGRFSCKLDFLKRFQQEIEFIAPGVPQGIPFTTQQLSGEEFWGPLTDGERRMAGICMTYLVDNGLVPFELVPRKGRNPYPLQYRIKC